ncbi:MAG: efflux RND transporter periplasmic adaptor subunit, partial [Actinomycetes bacterium]
AAQLAVDAAQRKLDQLVAPPAATVNAAQAELARAKADLAAVRENGSAARAAAAKSAVAAAEGRLDLLHNPAPETVSAARTGVAQAGADLAVLRQRGAPASKTDLAIAGLRVNVAEQQLRLARELTDRLTVRAPASGTVTSVLAAQGSAVDATSPLVRVQDLANLVVSLDLTEFDVSRTRVGAPVRISADALGGRPYSGTVADVALSGADTGGVVTFPVIASLDEPEGLRPGMSVSVRIVVASAPDAVRLPLDAIEERDGKSATIRVRTESGSIKDRDVELGLVGNAYAEVRSGLRAGEKVVIPSDDDEA